MRYFCSFFGISPSQSKGIRTCYCCLYSYSCLKVATLSVKTFYKSTSEIASAFHVLNLDLKLLFWRQKFKVIKRVIYITITSIHEWTFYLILFAKMLYTFLKTDLAKTANLYIRYELQKLCIIKEISIRVFLRKFMHCLLPVKHVLGL